jgi:hypothetical protein
MLNADIRILDCDDNTLTYEERVGLFENEWNEILSGKSSVADLKQLEEVLEREGLLGFRPIELYSKRPFTTITRLMQREGLSTTDLGVFLRWKAKNDNMTKARIAKLAKRKPNKKVDPKELFTSFLKSNQKGQPVVEF